MPRFDLVPFEPRNPISVKGGIRAHSRRGVFGTSWWSKRWIDVLEGFDLGARLSRGRSYARRGQVLSIEVAKGIVKASVQGSRLRPYRVTIRIETLDAVYWERLAASLGGRLLLMAELLAGRMPDNIEEIFNEAGLSLFPSRRSDLETRCSCPDSSNPCKHVAAVYLLLGEEFDRDPFLVFKLRGADRETLLGLAKVQTAGTGTEGDEVSPGYLHERSPDHLSPQEPLPLDPEEFWRPTNAGETSPLAASIPTTSASLPRQLGTFPFWQGDEDLLAMLEDMYSMASQVGVEVIMGEQADKRVLPQHATNSESGMLARESLEDDGTGQPAG